MLVSYITAIPDFHMWVTLGLIAVAIIVFAYDRIPMELTSMGLLSFLLLFFHFFPLYGPEQQLLLNSEKLLLGFANPALIAVVALLVVGHAVVKTGVLNEVANSVLKLSRNNGFIAVGVILLVVLVISGLLNNTPVVIIFIPIISAIAHNVDKSVSKVMIPLSYAAILGGMTTLIGSSTNLLVSGAMQDLGMEPLGFFDFTVPGIVMASVGFVYILFVAPRLLPDRASLMQDLVGEDGRKFIAQLEVNAESDLIGKSLESGEFPGAPDINIRMIQREEHAFLPPFDDDMQIEADDIIIVAASRKEITQLFAQRPESMMHSMKLGDDNDKQPSEVQEVSLAEVVVTPSSRMVGMNLEQIGFRHKHKCVVLGIQRQSRLIRARLTEIRLAAGDVLLVTGEHADVLALHNNNDMLLMEWSTEEIHPGNKAWHAGIIFASVVGVAALDIVPIMVSALVGAVAVIVTNCINLRQALRAVDSQIILLVAASLALGATLQATGGALFLAELLVESMHGASAIWVMSALFVLMVATTNVLSNNASAVLFTPIAINVAQQLGSDPKMFIFAVIFACNCSFITPMGYQTNLLVMAPGHNKFADFIRSGTPLAIIMWITYTVFAPWYFG